VKILSAFISVLLLNAAVAQAQIPANIEAELQKIGRIVDPAGGTGSPLNPIGTF
jgi:hypothetical protein